VHSQDTGPNGKPRILMASQPYGSGTVVVLALQNFWKWRLAKDAEQAQFDRFWQQMIRRLAEAGGHAVRIEVLDQELRPRQPVRLSLERTAMPEENVEAAQELIFRVRNSREETVAEQKVILPPAGQIEVMFVPPEVDHYTLEVMAEGDSSLASRVLEIREPNLEMQRTGRDMETLRQWAAISGGSAWTVEEARARAPDFTKSLLTQIEEARASRQHRNPVDFSWWSVGLVLGPLCAGWILRKRWMLK